MYGFTMLACAGNRKLQMLSLIRDVTIKKLAMLVTLFYCVLIARVLIARVVTQSR